MHNISTTEFSTLPSVPTDEYQSSFKSPTNTWVSFPVSSFARYVDAIVQDRLNRLVQQKSLSNDIRQLDDEAANHEIDIFIKGKKKSGINQLSILELSTTLKLPIEQIERVVESILQKGLIKEI